MTGRIIPPPDVTWSDVFEENVAVIGGNSHPSNPRRLYDRVEDEQGKSNFVPKNRLDVSSASQSNKKKAPTVHPNGTPSPLFSTGDKLFHKTSSELVRVVSAFEEENVWSYLVHTENDKNVEFIAAEDAMCREHSNPKTRARLKSKTPSPLKAPRFSKNDFPILRQTNNVVKILAQTQKGSRYQYVIRETEEFSYPSTVMEYELDRIPPRLSPTVSNAMNPIDYKAKYGVYPKGNKYIAGDVVVYKGPLAPFCNVAVKVHNFYTSAPSFEYILTTFGDEPQYFQGREEELLPVQSSPTAPSIPTKVKSESVPIKKEPSPQKQSTTENLAVWIQCPRCLQPHDQLYPCRRCYPSPPSSPDSNDMGRCKICDAIGPIGNFCSECEDSGAIYTSGGTKFPISPSPSTEEQKGTTKTKIKESPSLKSDTATAQLKYEGGEDATAWHSASASIKTPTAEKTYVKLLKTHPSKWTNKEWTQWKIHHLEHNNEFIVSLNKERKSTCHCHE